MIINLIRLGIIGVTAIWAYYVYKIPNRKERIKETKISWSALGILGAVMMFFDCLGIGTYAPLTFVFKKFKIMKDKLIPATLNTASGTIAGVESLIYITIIEVEPLTLASLIVAGSIGAWLGAGFVSKLPEKKIRLGMGGALLIVAFFILAGLIGLMPIGGTAIGLHGWKLALAILVMLVLGALMTIGVGSYAPTMAMVYMLGLSPRVAFPIMMGSCAFLIPIAGIRFMKEDMRSDEKIFDLKATIAISTAGILGVLVAAYIVKELPLTLLTWLVFFVVLYTSITMFRDGLKSDVKNAAVIE